MSVRPTSIQVQMPAYQHCWRLIWSHTHTQRRSVTACRVTRSSQRSLTQALKVRPELGDATSWQLLSKSTFPPLHSSFILCLLFLLDCYSPARLSSFISHTLPRRCEMASVFSHWETFQTFLSVCRAHAFLLFFLSSRCMCSGREAYLHAGAEPEPNALPLQKNNRAASLLILSLSVILFL